MYSHDTFGLGHLRRCREIAHALVERYKRLHVFIISGSSIAGAFDFRARVDFIKIPSVIKLYNGEYTSLAQHIDLSETLAMRRAIIQQTADLYQPNVFIVDKEPLGLRGELEPTLAMLKARGCAMVLGLREVLDAPTQVRAEWSRTDAMAKITAFYNEIWVYGSRNFYDPLFGLDVPEEVRTRMVFTGHLRRVLPKAQHVRSIDLPDEFILVTAGGGGDGGPLMQQVLAAREYDRTLDFPLVMILGPFMVAEEREAIRERTRTLANVTIIDFESQIEAVMAKASAIVSMGGYNTFCELLSFDKRALLVPRKRPRREQHIRAERAAVLGLVDMLDFDAAEDPRLMAKALRRLPGRPVPSHAHRRVDLDGLEVIGNRIEGFILDATRPLPSLAEA
jgi:predicted glycosyltransferase